MVDAVKRGFLRRIAVTLAAVQLLCAPPVAGALAAMTTSASDEAHCAEMMPAGDSRDDCPCCPEEGMSTAACLSNCLASVGAVPTFLLPQPRVIAARVPSRPVLHLASLADPPLKPPPIV
jgi:hypothetical protein